MTTGTKKYYNKRKEWNNNERVRFVKDKMFDSRNLSLYGKVDQEMDPVVYEFSFNKTLVGSTSRTEAQDFVMDAFDAFRGDIQDAYNTSLAYPQGFYTRYQPVVGHISVRELYRQRLYKIIAIFVNDYLSDLYISNKIKTIKDFMHQFERFCMENLTSVALTLSGFVLSDQCPAEISGIYISIGNYDQNNFEQKLAWLNDPAANLFRNQSRKHGFEVDFEKPWRLVARVESKQMQEYMQKYSIASAEDLFAKRFRKTKYLDVPLLRDALLLFYNEFLDKSPDIVHEKIVRCLRGDKARIHKIPRERASIETLSSYVSGYWMYNFYLRLRLNEMGSSITEKEYKSLRKKLNVAYKYHIYDRKNESDFIEYLDKMIYKWSNMITKMTSNKIVY